MNIAATGVREANHKTDLTIKNKLRVGGEEVGEEWVKWVLGIKEGTCDGHWVMYGIVESLYSTTETNTTLYVNCTGIKN